MTDANAPDGGSGRDEGGDRSGPASGDADPVGHPRPEFSTVDHAVLALLLEVAGTPKPGNVDRRRDYDDLRFEHFLAGGVGARHGLELAADGEPVGEAFEAAVAGMAQQSGGNTQFGCLLNLVPLVAAAADGTLTPVGVERVVAGTTVADAANFYRAFEHVDVAVGDPPEGMDDLDVRRGAAAVPAVESRGLTLADLMARSDGDGNAREWTRGFPRTFRAAEAMVADDGPATDRVARAFLSLLSDEPDTLVRVEHGPETAYEVMDRAAALGRDLDAAEDLAVEFHGRGINPGTTADVAAAATFVALERGLPV
jgi:triphosphoribosyl-dephospho-CoA synthase